MSTRPPRWRAARHALASVIVMTAAHGCVLEADPGAPRSARQSLNGAVVYDTVQTCSPAQKLKIEDAMAALSDALHATPEPLLACVRDAILSPDDGRFAERALAALAAAPTSGFTEIGCSPAATNPCGGASPWLGCAQTQPSGVEVLKLADAFVTNNSVAAVASVIAHEILHNRGFTHFGGLEKRYSVNDQVETCVERVLNAAAAAPSPYGLARSQMVGESEQQRFGDDEGAVFDRYCPNGSYLKGATFTTSVTGGAALIHAVTFRCAGQGQALGQPLPEAGSPPPVVPGVGPIAVPTDCMPDSVVVGVTAATHPSGRVDSVSLVCMREQDVVNGAAGPLAALPPVGGLPLVEHGIRRLCPPRMAVRAVLGRAGDAIDQLRLVCERLGEAPSDVPTNAGLIGGVGVGSDLRSTREHCSDRGVMFGLYGRAGDNNVERLGGQCRGTRRVGGVLGFRPGATDHITAAAGRESDDANDAFELACPAGKGLVAITATVRAASGAISSIQGACADLGAWDVAPPGTALPPFGPVRGTAVGAPVTASCAPGTFLEGFEIRSANFAAFAHRALERIVPICRRIGA